MFRFLGHPPREAVRLTRKAGVQERSKAEPRGGGRGLGSYSQPGPTRTANAGAPVQEGTLTEGVVRRGDADVVLELSPEASLTPRAVGLTQA